MVEKKELFAALQLGFVLSMCDGEYASSEASIINKICSHFGYELTPSLLHGEIAAMEPLETIETTQGLSLCFTVMALVASADGVIHENEFSKIVSVLQQFKEKNNALFDEFKTRFLEKVIPPAHQILVEELGLDTNFSEYKQLQSALTVLLTMLKDVQL